MVEARELVMDFVRPYFFSDFEEIDVLVALQEALSNALHGTQNDRSKTIHCSVSINSSAFTITVRDPGLGFDVEAATQPTETGANMTTHGRGCLMRRMVDEVIYRHGGAEVQLRKLRAVPSSIA